MSERAAGSVSGRQYITKHSGGSKPPPYREVSL